MDIQRSSVPGYEANIVTLQPQEQFMLRNPDNREDAVIVDTVVAFDPPTGSATGTSPADRDQASAYFVASGIDPTSQQPREIDHQFTDFGVLPPHIKERFPESWRTDRGAGAPVYAETGKYVTTQVRKARWRDERAATKGVATGQAQALLEKYRSKPEIPELTVVEYVDRTLTRTQLPTPPSTPLPTVAPVTRT